MALVLTGIMNGMRPVAGTIESGERAGEEWAFLSMEITDPRHGKVYSCQLRDKDKQYKDFVENGKLKTDLTDHKVKVTVVSMTAGERTIEDKETKAKRKVLQIRTQVTNLKDLGLSDEDED
jgi:hypothetical protein